MRNIFSNRKQTIIRKASVILFVISPITCALHAKDGGWRAVRKKVSRDDWVLT